MLNQLEALYLLREPLSTLNTIKISYLQCLMHSASLIGSCLQGILSGFFSIEVQLIYNVVLISAIQQSDLVIYIYFFLHSFPLRLSQGTEYYYLCYTVGPCCLSIQYALLAYICSSQLPTPYLHKPLPLFTTAKSVLYVCQPISVLY